jgi:hypothetical protein
MKLYCAWHKKYFGRELFMGNKKPISNPVVTHGACRKCLVKILKEVSNRVVTNLSEIENAKCSS